MTKRIPKVGDVYKCVVHDRNPVDFGEILEVSCVSTYSGNDTFVEFGNNNVWHFSAYPDDFELVASEQPKFKGKHYINVKAYAEKYGITLAKAHEEIQPKLFEMEYAWPIGQNIYNHNDCLVLNYFTNNEITHASVDFMYRNPMTEIIIEREEIININFSVKEAPIEYVEFNGKQYEKAKLEQALKLIEGDE